VHSAAPLAPLLLLLLRCLLLVVLMLPQAPAQQQQVQSQPLPRCLLQLHHPQALLLPLLLL
jgi:hypothetical protein